MHSVSHTEQYLIKICLISVELVFVENLLGINELCINLHSSTDIRSDIKVYGFR